MSVADAFQPHQKNDRRGFEKTNPAPILQARKADHRAGIVMIDIYKPYPWPIIGSIDLSPTSQPAHIAPLISY
jgi:hypothetical protein